jgi:hypothetical protein
MLEKITEIVKTRPESERWVDFLEFSSNVIITELIASGMSFNNYESKIALREAFLHISTRLSSKIGVAETLGYSVNRGQNKRLILTVEPSISITLPALSVIGVCKEADIVNRDPIIFNAGQIQDINVTVGRLFEEELTYSTGKPTRMRFLTEGVSEDVRLYLNDIDTEFTSEILEMTDGKFCMITNHLQSVDVLYLNMSGEGVKAGDVLKIRFVKREDLIYQYSDLKFDYGKIKEIKQDTGDQSIETLSQIEYNAPVSHEVQKVIRGRRDYHQYLPALNSDIVSSNYRDITPAVIAVTYLKKDETFFTPGEKEELLEGLMARRPFGVEPPQDLIDPVKMPLQLSVTITLMSYTVPPTMQEDIEQLLSTYDMVLATTINFKDCEKLIESSLDYVKIARVIINAQYWQDIPYRESDYVRADGSQYEDMFFKVRIAQKSGGIEPVWPTEPDEIVTDGRIIWQSFLAFQPSPDWKAATEYFYLATVKPVNSGTSSEIHYRCIGFVNKTGLEAPDWSLLTESLYYDNDIVWEIRQAIEGEIIPEWEADTQTDIGYQVNVLEGTLKAVCVGYCRKGTGVQPDWPLAEGEWVVDGELVWTCLGRIVKPQTLKWNEYFKMAINVNLEDNN